MLLSVVVIARDGNWTPSNGVIYATFLACVCCHGILASTMSKIMGKLQTVFVVANFILIFATIIALPIGARHKRNNGHYIFAQTENSTTWPTGWAFMLSWLSPIWTIGAFDSCVRQFLGYPFLFESVFGSKTHSFNSLNNSYHLIHLSTNDGADSMIC